MSSKSKALSLYYAVARGRNPGVYSTWKECKEQVLGFTNARYKKFSNSKDASNFIHQESKSTPPSISSSSSSSSSFSSSKRSFSTSSTHSTGIKRLCLTSGSEILVDEEGFTSCYTDGACSDNGSKKARGGVGVWFANHHPLNVSEPIFGDKASNNVAEIQAALRAVQVASSAQIHKLNIHTDSMFLINSMTKWLSGWKKRNWINSSNVPVINKEDFIRLDNEIRDSGIEVKWSHVKGHSGNRGNEMADELARKGSTRFSSQ